MGGGESRHRSALCGTESCPVISHHNKRLKFLKDFFLKELRLVRQQEDEDRKWRQRKLEIARMEAQRNEELRRVRTEQLRQRQEIAAKSVERDKQYWEEVRDMWQQSVEQDKTNQANKSMAKREYLSALQSQMAEKHQSKINHQSQLKDESVLQETDRKTHQSRTQQLREKKLQQLRYIFYTSKN